MPTENKASLNVLDLVLHPLNSNGHQHPPFMSTSSSRSPQNTFRLWDFLTPFASSLLRDAPKEQSWDARLCLQDELPSLNRLSDDILVDQVFSYLSVEDILALRRVSRLYYNLTHQGIIWKRFLKRIGPNAPELPPSSRYSPRFLTSFEAERLVIRALTLHLNWTCPRPSPLLRLSAVAHRQIQSMVVLPGGKYMIASASDATEAHYSLIVYALDHRTDFIVPLAETPVKQRAYNLKAKYMDINGVPSIVIAYIRRKISSRFKHLNIDPSKYNPIRDNPNLKIDAPGPIQYVCSCLQISLDALDALADPRLVPGSHEFLVFAASQPPPFRLLAEMRSTSELGALDLAIISGVPNIAVVKGSETIIFKELTGRCFTSTLTCARSEPFSLNETAICNFRILPHQHQVLVVRSVRLTPAPEIPPPGAPPILTRGFAVMAIFPLPEPGDNETPSYSSDFIATYDADDLEGVQISDPSDRASLRGTTPGEDTIHPPLSVFFRRRSSKHLSHVLVHPIPPQLLLKSDASVPFYALWVTPTCVTIELESPDPTVAHRAFVLPGTQRSLIYTTRYDDRCDTPVITGFYSHVYDPERKGVYSSRKRDMLQSILRHSYKERPDVAAKLHSCAPIIEDVESGVKAVAWDEEAGRIFYARPHDCAIYIISMALAPSQRCDGQRWPLPLADARMLDL